MYRLTTNTIAAAVFLASSIGSSLASGCARGRDCAGPERDDMGRTRIGHGVMNPRFSRRFVLGRVVSPHG